MNRTFKFISSIIFLPKFRNWKYIGYMNYEEALMHCSKNNLTLPTRFQLQEIYNSGVMQYWWKESNKAYWINKGLSNNMAIRYDIYTNDISESNKQNKYHVRIDIKN